MSKAILLVNLGSPDSPSVPDVRRYLNEFLMDGRVIDVPWILRRLIVGIVLISRPKESGHAYSTIWTPEGSPLIVASRHSRELLQKRVDVPEFFGNDLLLGLKHLLLEIIHMLKE